MIKTELLSESGMHRWLDELIMLLLDAVEHGASIGFTLPLDRTEAENYWEKISAEVDRGQRMVVVAVDGENRLLGSAQLAKESRPNGRHRAEVQKVMVLHAFRGAGIGRKLMERVEAEARTAGRTLLFLDTSTGSGGAVKFYRQLGYTFVGSIPDYAADPDGRLVPNAIFYKQLTGT